MLLLSSGALAECAASFGNGGPSLATAISKEDRREIERLLGAQLDHVVCSRTHRARGFVIQDGFFVLTSDEALFVSGPKRMDILFRTDFAGVRYATLRVFGDAQLLTVTTDAAHFRFTLGCDLAAQRATDEFERRTGGRTHVYAPPAGTQHRC
jgi:hypothetical protein